MADFLKAFEKLLKYEGYYSYLKDDKGGETFCGISRNSYPKWAGWKIVDSFSDKKFLINNKELIALVKLFYKEEFWNYFYLDNLSNQIVADEIFEGSVNIGKPMYCKLLLTTINLLNRNERLYSNVVVRNYWTQENNKQLEQCINLNGEKLVFNVLNCIQARHYINLMLENPKNEKWIGWFNRIEIVK